MRPGLVWPGSRGGSWCSSGLLVLTVRSAVAGGRLSGQVEHRVAVEEPERLEVETDPGDRHDRPVLRSYDVVGAEGVPHDEVGVLDRPVARGIAGQAVPAR